MVKFGLGPDFENLPVITLTEQDLECLKTACGIDFGEQHKSQIEMACIKFELFFRSFDALPDYAEVQRLLKPLYEGLRKTEKALDEIKKHRDEGAGDAIYEITKWHLRDSDISNLENIWQFYPPLAEMRVAVERLYNDQSWKVFDGNKGAPTDKPFLREFIIDLKMIFESAGGKASVPWYIVEEKRQSHFLEFVWTLMKKLPNDMRLKPKSALAERIKRYLEDYRKKGRKHTAQT